MKTEEKIMEIRNYQEVNIKRSYNSKQLKLMMSLCLLFVMLFAVFMPGNAFAAVTLTETKSGTATTNSYDTLNAAISAASTADTLDSGTYSEIKVTSDTTNTGLAQVSTNKKLRIDLNGYTVTRSADSTTNISGIRMDMGILEVMDSSSAKTGKFEITNTTGSVYAITIPGPAQVKITGGQITGKNSSDTTTALGVNATSGDLTITGGTVMGYGAGYRGRGVNVEQQATVTISGGIIKGSNNTNSAVGLYQSGSGTKVTITGGEFIAESISGNAVGINTSDGKFSISGAKIRAESTNAQASGMQIESLQECGVSNIEITSTAKGTSYNHGIRVSNMTSVTFNSVKINATNSGSGTCYGIHTSGMGTTVNNANISSVGHAETFGIYCTAGKLNVVGGTISGTDGNTANTDNVFGIAAVENSELTVENATITGTKISNNGWGEGILVNRNSQLTLKSGTVSGKSTSISGDAVGIVTNENSKSIVNGGNINAEGNDIVCGLRTSSGEIIFNNGTILAEGIGSINGIYGTSGEISVLGGTITATANGTSNTFGVYGTDSSDVTIENGTITATKTVDSGWGEGVGVSTNSTLTIKGGTITGKGTSTSGSGIGVLLYGNSTGIISDGNITASGDGTVRGISVESSTLTFEKASVNATGTKGTKHGIYASGTGTLTIKSGNITASQTTGTSRGIYVADSASYDITLGIKDGSASQSSPEIRGYDYGITGSSIKMYDGVVEAVTTTFTTEPATIEDEYSLYTDTTPIGGVTYKRTYLSSNGEILLSETKGGVVTKRYYQHVADALAGASAASELDTGTVSEIKMFIDEQLTQPAVLSSSGKNIKLDISGRTISIDDTATSFSSGFISNQAVAIGINGNSYFEIVDSSSGQTGKIKATSSSHDTIPVYLGGSAKFTLTSGSLEAISTGTSTYIIGLKSDSGTITINGGSILASGDKTVYGVENGTGTVLTINGGSIQGYGTTATTVRGVQNWNTSSTTKSLVMNDGKIYVENTNGGAFGIWISNNTITEVHSGDIMAYSESTSANAIGLIATKGTCNIYGGSFTGNGTTYGGRGIDFEGSVVGTIYGGTITGISETGSGLGLFASVDTTIESGEIIANVTGTGSAMAVRTISSANTQIKDGKISAKNTSTGRAYGVYITGGEAKIESGEIYAQAGGYTYGIYPSGAKVNALGGIITANNLSTGRNTYGIYAESSSEIVVDGSASISGINNNTTWALGVYLASNSTLNAKSGTITARNTSTGSAEGIEVTSGAKAEVRGATIDVIGESTGNVFGMDSAGEIYLISGLMKVTGKGVATGINSTSNGKIEISDGTITVDSSSDTVYGIKAAGSEINMLGGAITISNSSTGSNIYGIYVSNTSKLTIDNNATVSVTNNSTSWGEGIYLEGTSTFNGKGGTIHVKATSSGTAMGIEVASSSTAEMRGTTVEVTGESNGTVYGIGAYGTVKIISSEITVNGKGYTRGINGSANGKLDISGGKIKVNGTSNSTYGISTTGTEVILSAGDIWVNSGSYTYGIYASGGKIDMSGGNIDVSGDTSAKQITGINSFASGNVVISNGTIKTTSNTSSLTIGVLATSESNVKITGGTVESIGNSTGWVEATYSASDGVLTIEDGKIISKSTSTGTAVGVYITTDGKAIINSGDISAESSGIARGVQNGSGDVTVTGGKISALGKSATLSPTGIYGQGSAIIKVESGDIVATNTSSANAFGIYANTITSLDVENGTITANADSGTAVGIMPISTNLTMSNGNVTANSTNARADGLEFSSSPNSLISGGTITTNAPKGANYGMAVFGATGTLQVTGGRFVAGASTGTSTGLYVATSTYQVILGEENGTVLIDSPVIQGAKLGTTGVFEFYDGIIKGKTNAISGGIAGVTKKQAGYDVVTGSETIGLEVYETAFLSTGGNYSVTQNGATRLYPTLATAYAALSGNVGSKEGTIVVAKSNTDSTVLTVANGDKITLNVPSGMAITKTTSGITNNGELTITGSGTIQTAEVGSNGIQSLIDNNSTLTINGPTIDNRGTSTGTWLAIHGLHGTINIIDGSVKTTLVGGTAGSAPRTIELTNDASLNMESGEIFVGTAGAGAGLALNAYVGAGNTYTGEITISDGYIGGTATATTGLNLTFAGTGVNNGKVTITGGTIEGGRQGIKINTNATPKVSIENAEIVGGEYGIRNGGSTQSSLNISNSTVTGGTYSGILNEGTGVAIIGVKGDGTVSNSKPEIKGETYGIEGKFEFYDGIFMGKNAAISGDVNSVVTEKETGYDILVQESNGYKTAILVTATTITYDWNYDILQNMVYWNKVFSTRFDVTNSGTMNTVAGTTADGWEQIYYPITTVVGQKYRLSIDYDVLAAYSPLSGGYGGVGFQAIYKAPSSNNSDRSLATTYFPTTVSSGTKTLEFTATTTTTYIDINYGMAADSQTVRLKLGNVKVEIIESKRSNLQFETLPTISRKGNEYYYTTSMNDWNKSSTGTYTITTGSTTNSVSVTTVSGWEVLYYPVDTIPGKKYTASVDYSVLEDYTPLYESGVAFEAMTNALVNETNYRNHTYSLGTAYLPSTVSSGTKTIEFTATSDVTYMVFNFGFTHDAQTIKVNLGHVKIEEMEEYQFMGWYTEPTGGDQIVTTSIIPDEDIRYYAHWIGNYSVNGQAYSTLADAYAAVSGAVGSKEGIIVVEQNNTDSTMLIIADGDKITLDTNEKTVTCLATYHLSGVAQEGSIIVQGELTITGNGTITTGSDTINTTLIASLGTINISGATLTNGNKNNWPTVIAANAGTINIYNGELKSLQNAENATATGRTICIEGDTTLNLYDGIISTNTVGGHALEIGARRSGSAPVNAKINVYGGTIQATENTGSPKAIFVYKASSFTSVTKPDINIEGGNIDGYTNGIHFSGDTEGTITINGGTVQSHASEGILLQGNNAVEVKNGTVSGEREAIKKYGTKDVIVSGGTITSALNVAAIYNIGAYDVTISGGYLEGGFEAVGFSTGATGTLTVTGGTLVGRTGPGIQNSSSNVTVIFGTKDGSVSTTVPEIRSEANYSINPSAAGPIYFYDGILMGPTKAYIGSITAIEDNCIIIYDEKDGYQTATLAMAYTATFDYTNSTETTFDETGEYEDTGYIIDWDRDFTISGTFRPSVSGSRYLIIGNWPDETKALNLEVSGGKLRVVINYYGTSDYEAYSTETITNFNEDINYEFKWDAESHSYTLVARSSSFSTNMTGTYTDVSGKGTQTLRVGRADYRKDNGVDSNIPWAATTYAKNLKISRVYVVGESINPPVSVTRKGYEFGGWYTAEEGGVKITGVSIMPDMNVTYYAQWPLNYSVEGVYYSTLATAYAAVSGAVGSKSGTIITERDNTDSSVFVVAVGDKIALDTNEKTIIKTSNEIVNNGELSIYGGGKIKAGKSYSVTLNATIGTGGTTSVVAISETDMPSITVPTKTGYTFLGYFDEESGGTQYYTRAGESAIPWDKTSNATLYAQWTPNKYKVTLNNQSATNAGTEAVWYYYSTTKTVNDVLTYYYANEACTTPVANGYDITAPTRIGYNFQGYYTGTNGTGTQYINANGTFVNNIYLTVGDKTLYAYWTVKVTKTSNASGTYESTVSFSDVANYQSLTVDNFFVDLSSFTLPDKNSGTINITKTYNSSTGALTVSRSSAQGSGTLSFSGKVRAGTGLTKVASNQQGGYTISVNCTSVPDYKKRTADDFIVDYKKIIVPSECTGTMQFTKSYNANSGILTINRSSITGSTIINFVVDVYSN